MNKEYRYAFISGRGKRKRDSPTINNGFKTLRGRGGGGKEPLADKQANPSRGRVSVSITKPDMTAKEVVGSCAGIQTQCQLGMVPMNL